MKDIKQCFRVILSGDEESSRKAARMVRKLLYGSGGGADKYEQIHSAIASAPGKYNEIIEEFRQENFVVAISVIYFLHDREGAIDLFFPWFLSLLRHKNGNIRQAAVRMLEKDIALLTVHIRFPDKKGYYPQGLSPEKADAILSKLYAELVALIDDFWQPAYKKYKYVSSLPAGPYKSAQLALAILMDDCGDEYASRLEGPLNVKEWRSRLIERMENGRASDQAALASIKDRVEAMRREMEEEMLPAVQDLYPEINFQRARLQIYEGSVSLNQFIASIVDFIDLEKQDVEEANAFLDFVSLIWNIYPHKDLQGYSPYEIVAMEEYQESGADNK